MPDLQLLLNDYPWLGFLAVDRPWLVHLLIAFIILYMLGKWIGAFIHISRALGAIASACARSIRWIIPFASLIRDKSYHFIGLATAQDLVALGRIIQAVSKVQRQASARRRILRSGLLWFPVNDFYRYVGTRNPLDVDPDNLDRILQGPFCIRCGTRLFYPTLSGTVPELFIFAKCPRTDCGHAWTNETKDFALVELKRAVYEHLDAEHRIHGKIQPQQEPKLPKR